MSKEDASILLASFILVMKVFFGATWAHVKNNLRALFSDNVFYGMLTATAVGAFAIQIFFAFVTGGASLLLAPIAMAVDTAFIFGIALAFGAAVSIGLAIFQGVQDTWNTVKSLRALGAMFEEAPVEEEKYGKTPGGARDWSGEWAKHAARQAAEESKEAPIEGLAVVR
jgi:NAD/NADP transhydrogenase alpha subunit